MVEPVSKRIEEQREATRDALTRGIVRLLTIIAIAIVAILAFERRLGITPETVKTLERMFTGVVGLAAIVASFYYFRRR